MNDPAEARAIEYLENLQKDALIKRNLDPEARRIEGEARFLATAIDGFRAAAPDDPGPLEAWAARSLQEFKERARSRGMTSSDFLPSYIILLDRVLELEQVAATTGVSLHPRPIVGTIAVPLVNAKIAQVPGTDRFVVAFFEDFFMYAMLFAKVVALALPVQSSAGVVAFDRDDQAVRGRLEQTPEILARFQDMFVPMVMSGSPASAQQYWLDPYVYKFAQTLWESMELFAVGHEFGHFINRDLDADRTTASVLADRMVQTFRPSHAQELASDSSSLPLVIGAMRAKGADTPLAFAGADLFFASLDLLERALSLVSFGDEDHQPKSESHPPAESRRENLRRSLRDLVQRPDDAELVVGLADQVGGIIEYLWMNTRNVFLRFHHEGRRPQQFPG